MRYELYKILKKHNADDFIAGDLYMNTLNFFRRIEGNVAQGDPLEGVCGSVRKDQLKQVGIDFDENVVDAIIGNVSLLSDYYGLNNLLCLYKLYIDDDRRLIEQPEKELREFDGNDGDDRVVVRIKDTEQFLHRVAIAVENGVHTHEIEYGVFGGVTYSNAWNNADGLGTRSAFHKEPKYKYQNEWRLCLLRNALRDEPYVFQVGDLSDITEVVNLDQFLEQPESLYPGYSVRAEKVEVPSDGFRVFGSLNAINHLMYSYMTPSGNIPTRSDQAQADWHYTKYLELVGKKGDIDSYLETKMKQYKDFDHLELLVQYRLSVGQWVKATDAFMFFINEVPTVIEKDPAKFFFGLHTILMQHREAADAGKLLKLAEEKYQLPSDLIRAMKSDVLFALEFYDQVVPLFMEMKKTSVDPVLDYDLAVSYLHLLDFEQAHQYLSAYEVYFSHSPQKAEKTVRLRGLIDCFRNKAQLSIMGQTHPFEELAWDETIEKRLKDAKLKSVFLGIDAVYRFEKWQKWDILNGFEDITICPALISEIMSFYRETGDPVFYHSIIRLKNLPNLKIQSPEFIYYLALDFSDRDMPSIMKMEKALLLQKKCKETS